ncbi:MAG: ZIP family metal transporter [bacterium]
MLLTWLYSLISVIIVSLLSLIGIFTLSLGHQRLNKILLYLVSFAAGAMLGDVFIHIIPEVSPITITISLLFLAGILLFFILEKFIHWRHCHVPNCEDHQHPMALMNLVGDGLHNLMDGMIIAGSFLVSIPLGIATTLAVALHEIPQEIGDFGVLLHGGYSRQKALWLNLLSASLAIIGTIIVLLLNNSLNNLTNVILPLTAGGFIYIAGSDLIPELHKETTVHKSLIQLCFLLLGIMVMLGLTFWA